MTDQIKTTRIIRLAELANLLSVSKSTLWRMRSRNELPAPIYLSTKIIGWDYREIEEWLVALKAPNIVAR